MEEMLGNFAGARQIFERWMEWQPEENPWNSYIKFEMRHGEVERARLIFAKYVSCHNIVSAWLKWAKFEEKQSEIERARQVYQQAIDALGDFANNEALFIAFAKLEEKDKEYERCRTIYKYALDHIPKANAKELYKMWISFEKQHGDRQGIEDVIIGKRRFLYEEEIKINPLNYDIWFDYIRLEETNGEKEKVREVYERAIANLPPVQEKRYWRRYIYLWINYALYEELETKEMEMARGVYKQCLSRIPHKQFSFSKIWILFANFEIRQLQLQQARQIFGQALGIAKNAKIFRAYIDLEQKLGNIDRCRLLYAEFLKFAPENCQAWCKFAELEKSLTETERTRAIYELAIEQPVLDMPEIVWKAYIDFEIAEEEYERTQKLYRRLLERTKHVKVWISFAQFENSLSHPDRARAIFKEAYHALADPHDKEERVMLIESWKQFEESIGDPQHINEVIKLMPEKIKKKRQLKADDGSEACWEEYYDYIFPEDRANQPHLKLLENARKWKRSKLQNSATATVENEK